MLKVLMIDDDREDFLLVRAMLESVAPDATYVEWVPNVVQALTLLGIGRYSVFLVDRDLGAGEATGGQFIARARSAGVGTPAVLYTGTPREGLDPESLGLLDTGVVYLNKQESDAEALFHVLRRHSIHELDVAEWLPGVTGRPTLPGLPAELGHYRLSVRTCNDLSSLIPDQGAQHPDLIVLHLSGADTPQLDALVSAASSLPSCPCLLLHDPDAKVPVALQPLLDGGRLHVAREPGQDTTTLEATLDALLYWAGRESDFRSL